MSLRNRSRHLQSLTDLTYNQALDAIRNLSDEPAKLADKWNWPLSRCDADLYDEHLDDDYRAALEVGGRSAHARECDNCWTHFFIAWSLEEGELEDRKYYRQCVLGAGGSEEDDQGGECLRCYAAILPGQHLCDNCSEYVDS